MRFPNLKKFNCLIIDNKSSMRRTIKSILNKELQMENVLTCESIQDTIETTSNIGKIDIIILDQTFENPSDLKILNFIREDIFLKETPLIITLNNPNVESIMFFKNIGITECICKPFTPIDLCSRIVRKLEEISKVKKENI